MVLRLAALTAIAVAVVWTFSPVARFAFLNWDDGTVLVQNPALAFPGVVAWAFTTTFMEHYQPLSWLVWAAIKAAFGLDPRTFHLTNVVVHIACVLLVWVAGRLVLGRVVPDLAPRTRETTAMAAAVLFGLHPLRVEVVAWLSALPYALALAFVLASLAAYLHASGRHAVWWVAALVLYAASLASRPVALGFPIVLVVLDAWGRSRAARASLARTWPFAGLALAAAGVESLARVPGLNDTPWLYRLQSAAGAPFVYVWHTVLPVALTPLDVLPERPAADPVLTVGALIAVTLLTLAAWKTRRAWPALSAAWIAYLALLAPAAGLVPSGLQATADRYAYVPGVVLALVAAGAGAQWAAHGRARLRIVAAAFAMLSLLSALSTRRALSPWSDSVSLWSRVVALDQTNDVGLYNLASALAEAGRPDEAARRYRELLALQPAHGAAKANLDLIDAARLEAEGNAAAARGDLAAAAGLYGQAIALDPKRTHSQAGRGMALATLGRGSEAIPALREAWRQDVRDPAVPNALAVLLLQAGQAREARGVLERALAMHPQDVGLAHNLARLLATSTNEFPDDAGLALRLARAVVDATGDRDPRAMETLAAALAANGRMKDAIEQSARAAALATAQGDHELAVQITARGRAYRSTGQ